MTKSNKAYTYTFLSIFLWSFIPVVSSLGGKSLGVEQFLLVSNFLSTLAILPFVNFKMFDFSLKSTLFSMVLSLLGIFGYYLLLYYAYFFSSNPAQILIIQYLWPIFIAIFSVLILGEKLGIKKSSALALGFVSAFLVITKGHFVLPALEGFKSIFLAFLASISFGLYSVLSKKRESKHLANDIFIYFFIALLFSIGLFFIKGEGLHIRIEDYVYLLINGVFVNGISYLFWIWALKSTQASKLSVFVLITPLISVIWIYLFLHEPIEIIYLFALIFSLISGYLALV